MSASFDPSYSGRPRARFLPNPKLRFLDQCREVLRFKQMARRTEEAYVDWIRRFIVWARDNRPHPGPLPSDGRGSAVPHVTPAPLPLK